MILGALVDLGLPLEWLQAELARLPLGGYHLESSRVRRGGLVATRVEVVLDERQGSTQQRVGAPGIPANERRPSTSLGWRLGIPIGRPCSRAHEVAMHEHAREAGLLRPMPTATNIRTSTLTSTLTSTQMHPHHRGLSEILDLLERSTLDR